MTKYFGSTSFWLTSSCLGLLVLFFALIPISASAQTANPFVSMVDIPGISGTDGATNANDFGGYVNALYIFAITVGAMLAVLKLILAGVKYMFSDIVTKKEEAKADIKGAILGLLIVIGAITILSTINTDLTEVNLNIDSVGVNANDALGGALVRLRSRVEVCNEDKNCGMESCSVTLFDESCQSWCEAKNNGEWYPSAFFGGTCFYELETESFQERCVREGGTFDEEINDCVREGDIVQRISIEIMCMNPNGCVATNGIDNLLGVAAAQAECERRSDGSGLLNVISPAEGICYWAE